MTDHDFHYLAQEVEAPASKGGEVDALREALAALQAERDKSSQVPEHGTWVRGRQCGLDYAIRIVAALATPAESEGEQRARIDQGASEAMGEIVWNCAPAKTVDAARIDTVWSLLIEAGNESLRWTAEKIAAALLTPTESAGSEVERLQDTLDRLIMLTPSRANASTAHDLHLSIRAIAESALAKSPGYSDRPNLRNTDPTTPSASGAAIPAGMKPWSGGDSAPDDWDGEAVWTRNLDYFPAFGVCDWRHYDNDADIIAYTPRAEQTGEVSRYHFTNDAPVTITSAEGEVQIGAGWLAITEAEYAALSPPIQEAVAGGDLSSSILPMDSAPKDGRYIIGYYRSLDNERTKHWDGRAFVIRHEGQTASEFDLGWGLFPGYGGVPDICFTGWSPLPVAIRSTTERGGAE